LKLFKLKKMEKNMTYSEINQAIAAAERIKSQQRNKGYSQQHHNYRRSRYE